MLNLLKRTFLDTGESAAEPKLMEVIDSTSVESQLATMYGLNQQANWSMQMPKKQELRWLQAEENVFGRRVFDCRKIALNFNSTTHNKDIIQRFRNLQQSTGKEFDLLFPKKPVKHKFEVTYPSHYTLKEGAVCKSSTMAQKWNIYRWGNRLYFVKSWTGELKYVAFFSIDTAGLTVHHIYTDEDNVYAQDSSYIGKRLDFLINSHLLEKEVPHPLPNYLSKEDEQSIISFSFSEYGNKGCFATFDY